jgi:hypothetical protein
MNVQELIDALGRIEDKSTQVYFDATIPGSPMFLFKSIDVVEEVEDDTDTEMIILSCGLEPSDGRISLN